MLKLTSDSTRFLFATALAARDCIASLDIISLASAQFCAIAKALF
jgi:hypothetical protein